MSTYLLLFREVSFRVLSLAAIKSSKEAVNHLSNAMADLKEEINHTDNSLPDKRSPPALGAQCMSRISA